MKRHHTIALCLGFALGLLFASSPAEARDPSPLTYSYRLNGTFVPTLGEDAGVSGVRGLLLYGSTNVASAPVTGGRVYYVECAADGGAIHLCTASTDGGCSADPTDINWGPLVTAGGFKYVTVQDTTTRIYATGDTATAFTCPVRPMY